MAYANTDKVVQLFRDISARNFNEATEFVHSERYQEHAPKASDGADGFRDSISRLPSECHIEVIRLFEDGQYVFGQIHNFGQDSSTSFEVFRFEDGLIVEHWAFSAQDAPANRSGHTQIDGPTVAEQLDRTESNKALVRNYYEAFHIRGDHSRTNEYFNADLMIRHEPGVHDGVSEFLRDVEQLMQHRTIEHIELLLGQGNFVFVAAKGTHEGNACVYLDLYRVENQKIVEHWGFPEPVPSREQRGNSNGLL